MADLKTTIFAARLGIAIGLGALVGLERQYRQRMAGTRTTGLVAAGASAFVMAGSLLGPGVTTSVVAYVVSGVGFLGAGVIFKDGANVQGLNTAATIWCSAAIGVLAALGVWQFASVLAGAVILTNLLLRPLARRLRPVLPEALPAETTYQLRLTCKEASIAHIRALLLATISRLPITLQALHEEDDVETGAASLRAEIRTAGRDTEAIEQVVMRISIEDDVSALSWSISESLMD